MQDEPTKPGTSFFKRLMLDAVFSNHQAAADNFRIFHARNRRRISTRDSRGEPSFFTLTQDNERIVAAALAAIESGEYELGPAIKHMLETDKARVIHHFNWVDTFIIFHLARSLFKCVEAELPDCLFSYRPGRSVAQALSRVKRFLEAEKSGAFVVRRDVKSFGDEMSHEVLRRDFMKYGSNSPHMIKLFEGICRFRGADGSENERGLPGGHYIQLVMENLYLIDLDRELSLVPEALYIRFGDDIFFASRDCAVALKAAETIDRGFASRGVRVNESKSLTFELKDPGRAAGGSSTGMPGLSNFQYLGSQVFWNGALSVPPKKLAVLRKFLRARLTAVERALSNDLPVDRVRASVAAVRNILISYARGEAEESPLHGIFHEVRNDAQLREFDRWLMQIILKTGFGGFKKGNFRKISPGELRRMGLPSLLHLRRTGGIPG